MVEFRIPDDIIHHGNSNINNNININLHDNDYQDDILNLATGYRAASVRCE